MPSHNTESSRRRTFVATLLCVASLCSSAHASPGVSSDQYPAPPGADDGFAVGSPSVGEHLQLSARATIDYLRNPIVYQTQRGTRSTEQAALVRDQLRVWLGSSLALWKRLLVFVRVPVDLVMSGERLGDLPSATGAGFGDLALGVRGFALETEVFRLGAQLVATAPTAHDAGDRPAVAGDRGAMLIPRILAELRFGRLRIGADLGLRIRKNVDLPTIHVTDQFLYALAVRGPLFSDHLEGSAEVFGAAISTNLGERDTTSLEALLGLTLRNVVPNWSFGVAGGAGLLRGYGTPDARILARAGWSLQLGAAKRQQPEPVIPAYDESTAGTQPPPPAPTPAEAEPLPPPAAALHAHKHDRDNDGRPDDSDACPSLPGPEQPDGCPALVSVERESGAITLDPMPQFGRENARIDLATTAAAENLASALSARPEVRIMLSAHLSPAHRRAARDLGAERARALGQWLNQRGVDPAQLELYDCGTSQPLADAMRSERIELYLIAPAPPQAQPSTLGCQPITLQL